MCRCLPAPGEEAQIDFGYLGKFTKDGKEVKVWYFAWYLSHSRYAFYTTVTSQSHGCNFYTAICKAFEFFGGVPRSLLIG